MPISTLKTVLCVLLALIALPTVFTSEPVRVFASARRSGQSADDSNGCLVWIRRWHRGSKRTLGGKTLVHVWFLTAILGAASLWLSLLNWYTLIRQTIGKPSPSWIPLLGGVLGVLALWSAPGNELSRFFWLPLVVDGGCAPALLLTLFWYFVHSRKRGK